MGADRQNASRQVDRTRTDRIHQKCRHRALHGPERLTNHQPEKPGSLTSPRGGRGVLRPPIMSRDTNHATRATGLPGRDVTPADTSLANQREGFTRGDPGASHVTQRSGMGTRLDVTAGLSEQRHHWPKPASAPQPVGRIQA